MVRQFNRGRVILIGDESKLKVIGELFKNENFEVNIFPLTGWAMAVNRLDRVRLIVIDLVDKTVKQSDTYWDLEEWLGNNQVQTILVLLADGDKSWERHGLLPNVFIHQYSQSLTEDLKPILRAVDLSLEPMLTG